MLAIPSISKSNLKSILDNLNALDIPVLQIPSLNEIISGKAEIDKLRPIEIEDLLGRDVIFPKKELLVKDIKNNIICVTGAGGSIGKELCRQILKLKPKTELSIFYKQVVRQIFVR